jgi:DNA-binding CsgD family transcriptional regulator
LSANLKYLRKFDFSKLNRRESASDNQRILKALFSELEKLSVSNIVFLQTPLNIEFSTAFRSIQTYPENTEGSLLEIVRLLLHPDSQHQINQTALNLSPVYCRTQFEPAGNQSEQHFILARAFGPNGRSATFILKLLDNDRSLSIEEMEFAESRVQSAFMKILAHQMNMEKVINLTPREKDIVKWIARGKSNPDIAQIIGISIHTVNGYLRGIYLKTQTGDRVSLSFFALRYGLIV